MKGSVQTKAHKALFRNIASEEFLPCANCYELLSYFLSPTLQ